MIILRGGSNEVSLTLNEKYDFYTPSVSTYQDLYYVVKIEDNMSEYTQNFILLSTSELSLNPERSNKFKIEVTGTYNSFLGNTPDPWSASQSYPIIGLTGSNEFDFDSQWDYKIYALEGPAPTSGTISIAPNGPTALGPVLLEQGRMIYTNKYGKPRHLPH